MSSTKTMSVSTKMGKKILCSVCGGRHEAYIKQPTKRGAVYICSRCWAIEMAKATVDNPIHDHI